ncbi:MAG: sensor histidine kinase [Lachnospiraceae bacterium]|nr:sensor histidine kinase [Lachnospiraceae bacterium]
MNRSEKPNPENSGRRWLLLCLLMLVFFNLYFVFLLRDTNFVYLLYFDFLLLLCILLFTASDCRKKRRHQTLKQELLQSKKLICRETDLLPSEDLEIAGHDVQILENQLQEQFEQNCDLQDYIARWCHEVKIPLAAAMLIDEKIKDPQLRSSMEEQLERINQQVNSALLGCRLQSSLLDIQLRPVNLSDAVRTSMQNNRFFLIQKHFQPDIQVEPLTVYSDREWLVYVLDQLLANSVKYAGDAENPVLKIRSEQRSNCILLTVEDNGEGIPDSDLRRIFEKGFTGSNRHNGQHKSTGMGLYMVSLIMEKLSHEILAESEYGSFTRFTIIFRDNRDFFHPVLQKP